MPTFHARLGRASAILSVVAAAVSGNAAVISWTNSASGLWSSAANWSPNSVPGSTDTAVINVPGVTVSLNAAEQAGGIKLGTNSGGTVTLALSSQTLSLFGNFQVNPSGSVTLHAADVLSGATNATVSGLVTVNGGTMAGTLTVNPGATVNVAGTTSWIIANLLLTNSGTVNWSGAGINAGGDPGTVIYNNGLWVAQDDQPWQYAYGGNGTTFNNLGTFRKSATTGGSTAFVNGNSFNNSGNMDCRVGTISLQGGGALTGGTITNTVGRVDLDGGNFNINGVLSTTNLQINGAALVGANVFNGGLNWITGNWNNSETIAPGSVLNIVSANDHNLANCTITNEGFVFWMNGAIQGGGNPGTVVYNSGLWDAQSDQTWGDAYGGNGTTFNNTGTLRKSRTSGGATAFVNGVTLNSAGNVDSRAGIISLQGGATFTGGMITNKVGLVDLDGGSVNINGALTTTNVQLNGANLVGANLINGGLNWIAGSWNSSSEMIDAGAVINILGPGNHDVANCNITNFGSVLWNNGTIRGGGNPGTIVQNNGLWDAQSDQTWSDDFGGSGTMFNNSGIFRKSGGQSEFTNSTTLVGGVFFNQIAGQIDVQNGSNGLELALQGGANLLGGYITTNARGLTVLSAGSFNINGTITGTNTWEDAGNLVGANVIQGALTWIGGVWDNATVTVKSNATVLLNGGGLFDLADATITNYGRFAWTGPTIRGGGNPGTVVYNYGLWDAQSDRIWNDDFGGSGTMFNNSGIFRKSGGQSEFTNSTTLLGGVFFNQLAGQIDVQNGTNGLELALQGGGSFTGGSITTNARGLTVLSAGSFTINGTVTGLNTWEDAGNLVGANVILGGLTWVGGIWSSAASVTIAHNSTLDIAGALNNDVADTIITNLGDVVWTTGTIRGGGNPGTVVYNYGQWLAEGDQAFNDAFGGGGIVFNNLGLFRKNYTSGQTVFANGVTFTNGGTLDTQSGTIVLQGAYSLTNGDVNFGITTSTNYGQLSLAGAANLGAEMSANLINPFYWPPVGATFNLITYGSRNGIFTSTNLPAYLTWTTNYSSTLYSISVVSRQTNPAPATIYFTRTGSTGLNLAWYGDRTGWMLQGQTNPPGVGITKNWTNIPGTGVTNLWSFTIDTNAGSAFFRLAYP